MQPLRIAALLGARTACSTPAANTKSDEGFLRLGMQTEHSEIACDEIPIEADGPFTDAATQRRMNVRRRVRYALKERGARRLATNFTGTFSGLSFRHPARGTANRPAKPLLGIIPTPTTNDYHLIVTENEGLVTIVATVEAPRSHALPWIVLSLFVQHILRISSRRRREIGDF